MRRQLAIPKQNAISIDETVKQSLVFVFLVDFKRIDQWSQTGKQQADTPNMEVHYQIWKFITKYGIGWKDDAEVKFFKAHLHDEKNRTVRIKV